MIKLYSFSSCMLCMVEEHIMRTEIPRGKTDFLGGKHLEGPKKIEQ